jgi:hypothetical protein|tara:strand:- start:672 stop:1145 length:474 start_codon:yes stop_codon:yes gene_type:complete
MGILDFFKFSVPKHKKFGLFISRYLTHEKHIRLLYVEITHEQSLRSLNVELDIFIKHVKAMMTLILSARVQLNFDSVNAKKFRTELIQSVENHDSDIANLVVDNYSGSFNSGGIPEMINELSKRLFENKLDDIIKLRLFDEMNTTSEQFKIALQSFK